jgi:hypothetical protein
MNQAANKFGQAIDLRETLMNKVGEYGLAMVAVGDLEHSIPFRERLKTSADLFVEILRLSGELRDLTKEG